MAKPLTLFMLVGLFQTTVAAAFSEDMPSLSFNGFGTAGVVYSDEDQADFVSNITSPDGAGHSRDLSPEVDSRLGLQLTATLAPRLSGIVQVITEQRHDDTYKPKLEWANLKYQVTPDLSVSAGRVVLPTFMASEYRKVGFATPWVRPPQEVYNLVPVASNDGFNGSYRLRFGDYTNTVKANIGRSDIDTPNTGEAQAEKGVTLANTLEFGFTTLFTGYSTGRLTIEGLNPLFDGFRQFGPRGGAIADRFDVDDKRYELLNVGARHDRRDWFVMGEWARSETRTFFGESEAWYLSGGYRYGSLTPYVTLARVRAEDPTSNPGLSTAGLPAPAAAQANSLNASLNQLLASTAQQKSVSLGVRWDFAPSRSLKLQYDHLDLDDGSRGILTNTQSGFEPGGTVNVFSVALDFLF